MNNKLTNKQKQQMNTQMKEINLVQNIHNT